MVMRPGDVAGKPRRAFAQLFGDQSGASATVIAIALPALMGFAALGAETGLWFTIKLQNQSAADAAALSAAYEIIAGNPNDQLVAAASKAAAQNGYRGSTPAVIYPYADEIVSNAVAVTLRQTEGALLAAPFLSGVDLVTKAVAGIAVIDNPCLLALAISGTDVEVAGTGHLAASGCSVAANSSSASAIDLQAGTSTVAAATLVTAGQVSLAGNPVDPAAPPPGFSLATPARIGAPILADPYSGTLTHAFLITGMPLTGKCKAKNSGHVRTYEGRCIADGSSLTQSRIALSADTQIAGPWTVTPGQIVDLSPGTYWVTGGDLTIQSSGVLKCSGCDNASGVGVTIVLTVGATKIGALSSAAGSSIALNAPSTGRFAGLVLVQDGNALPAGTTYTSRDSVVRGSPGAVLNGLVYFPNSSLTFTGAPSAAGPKCLLLVVNTVIIDGASSSEHRRVRERRAC